MIQTSHTDVRLSLLQWNNFAQTTFFLCLDITLDVENFHIYHINILYNKPWFRNTIKGDHQPHWNITPLNPAGSPLPRLQTHNFWLESKIFQEFWLESKLSRVRTDFNYWIQHVIPMTRVVLQPPKKLIFHSPSFIQSILWFQDCFPKKTNYFVCQNTGLSASFQHLTPTNFKLLNIFVLIIYKHNKRRKIYYFLLYNTFLLTQIH